MFPLQSSLHHRQEAQVLKALVLGEEERGQSQYQVMCFVTKFQKGDFITSDAMAKLRQVRENSSIFFFLSFPQWYFRLFIAHQSPNSSAMNVVIWLTSLNSAVNLKDLRWKKKAQ